MKTPGPDHPIIIAPHPKRVRVTAGATLLAETEKALSLQEANYPAVRYIPREDVPLQRLRRTDHRTHCPYKGEASYYTLLTDAGPIENGVWSYEDPYPAMAAIRGYLAFYPNKVDRIEDL